MLGLASVGRGIWLLADAGGAPDAGASTGPSADPAGPTGTGPTGTGALGIGAGASQPAGSGAGRPAVSGGAGVWEQPAPNTTAGAAAGARCPGCDIVVITVCSLRRDHVSAYGLAHAAGPDGAPLTPQLDALTGGGYRMDQAWAASNFTLAGLTAVLTGRFGSATGVTGWDKGLVSDVPTLPEVLGDYGYRTAAFTVDAPSGFRPDYGLDRGFQRMEIIPSPRDNPDGRSRGGEIGPGGAAARPAAAWIAAQPHDQPIFAMLHTRTAHYPFVIEDDPSDPTGVTHLLWEAGGLHPNPGQVHMPGTAGGTAQRGVVGGGPDPVQVGVRAAGPAGVAMWRQRYAEAVHRMDIDIGVIADAIAARGRDTIVVVLADHGESLDDHGELLHGDAYYDGVVHVPMLVRVPGMPGGAVSALVSQVDVLPTLLDLIGAVPPAGIDGASMVPLYTGAAPAIRSTTLVEGGVAMHADGIPRGAVIALPWALLEQDQDCGDAGARRPGHVATCLYDLDHDPGEEHNVAVQHPDVVAELEGRWEKFRAANAVAGDTLTLDPAFVKELQRTGYNFRPEER